MTPIEIEFMFNAFLKKEKCFTKYYKNIASKDEFYHYLDTQPLSLISGTFDWRITNEGHSYWMKKSNKWKDYYNNIDKIFNFKQSDYNFKLFIRFLKENNIYEKYFNNITYEWTYKCLDYYDIIYQGFSWTSAKEGYSFWKSINVKWRNILKNGK